MEIINEDEFGLYVYAGGWKCREVVPNTTKFKVGDRVKTYHFGGSTKAGVGKDENCKRGQYLEYWVTTTGGISDEPDTAEIIEQYRTMFSEWAN